MRILAIRGENLASIPSFAVELDRGPLAATRIFAITGPTGAGKSTLLDTIALALYDRAPRLLHARDTGSGEPEVRGADPRAIMRRHAVEASAEVDFLGQDHVRYRARWEAWRARRRVDGRLQNQRLSLADLDHHTDLTGATKTETLGTIRERVGLSFDEFRRAVLLAQGDFAAFLEASAHERAELLERMTGSEIYARVSCAAHVRARAEAQALEALETRRDAIRVATVQERESLHAERATLEDNKRELDAEVAALQVELRWHETRARLQDELEKARRAREGVEAAWRDAEPERALVASRRAAGPLAGPLAALVDARARHDACRRTAAEARAAQGAAEHLAAEATSALLRAREEARTQKDRLSTARPEIDQARTLDARLMEARREQQEAEEQSAGRRAQWREAADRLEAARDAVEGAAARAAALDEWHQSRAELAAIARAWSKWETALHRAEEAVQARAEGRDRTAALASDVSALEEKAQVTKAQIASLEDKLARHREVHARAAADLDEHRAAAARSEVADAREILARRMEDLDRMRDLPKEARRLERRRGEAVGRLSRSKADAKRRRQEKRRLKAEVARLESALSVTRAALDEAEALRTLIARRSVLLAEGAPCPLCGATHHPLTADAPRPAKSSREKKKAAKLEGQLEEAKEQLAALRSSGDRAERERETARRIEEVGREIEEVRAEWTRRREQIAVVWVESPILARRNVRRLALELPEQPDEKHAVRAAAEVSKKLERERSALASHASLEDERDRKVERAKEKVERTRSEIVRRTHALETTRSELDRLRADHGDALRIEQELTARLAAIRSELVPSYPGVLDRLESEPAALRDELSEHVRELEQKQAEARDAAEATRNAEQVRALALARHDEALAALRAADDTRGAAEARTAGLAAERAVLTEGRSAADFERALEAAAERAADEVRTRQEAAETAGRAIASARAYTAAGEQAVVQAEQTLAATAEAFETAFAGTSFEGESEVAELLAMDEAAVDALERSIEAVREARLGAKTTERDGEERLEAHGPSPYGDRDLETATVSFRRREEAREKVVERGARVAERLEQDERARRELEALAPRIDARRKTVNLWSDLNALIGSADGKKLRTFAQGLTLDALVEQANLHLSQLRPRYRLRRVAARDMELEVIDGDLGDEVRATSTLSGGERFLVSLALALGLSSLSARQVRIDSLFVDEGFGSLDRDSLEAALETLDRLQSEGRTVGVISHIPEIAERIGYRVEVRPVGPGESEVKVVVE